MIIPPTFNVNAGGMISKFTSVMNVDGVDSKGGCLKLPEYRSDGKLGEVLADGI